MRLIATLFLTSLFAVFTLVPDAFALQDDRIVVTGTRIAQFQNDQVPAVTIERRADELSIEISIEGDTRDPETRTAEIRQTLERVFRAAARDPLIQLDVEITRQLGEERYQVLRPFSEGMVRSIPIRSGRRPDSSVVVVRATTPIRENDTRADINSRIASFVASIDVVGRAEVSAQGAVDLIIAGGPARYRGDLIAEIAADAHRTAEQFGDDFTVDVSGMEDAIRWQRSDELSLRLYINYDLAVSNG